MPVPEISTADPLGASTIPPYPVVVIGASISGIAAAVRLTQTGIHDFVVDRTADHGGTWRDNTYPGVAVDIPSVAYQFTFWRNPKKLSKRGGEGLLVRRLHGDRRQKRREGTF